MGYLLFFPNFKRFLSDEFKEEIPECQEKFSLAICAVKSGTIETVEALLVKGADVNAKDSSGYTALMRAAWSGHSNVAKVLLEKGADLTGKDNLGHKALGIAKIQGQTDIIRLLKVARLYGLTFDYKRGIEELVGLFYMLIGG